MESGKELNYWPGFVDALSNVVLTLVFVLVVFVFALVMASNKVEQKVIELAQQTERRQEQQIQVEHEVLELRQELRETLEQLQRAEAENGTLRQQVAELRRQQVPGSEERNELKEKVEIRVEQQARDADSERDDTAEIDRNTGVIVIVFPRGIFEINDKARAELDRSLASQRERLAGMTVSVRSVVGVETYSEARRLAYFRGLTVRNYLIDKGLGSGKTINMVIEQAKEVGDGRVEIRFHRR
jgi:hypothetical protein